MLTKYREVLDRSRVQTSGVDIWSLGIVATQMLAIAVDFDFSILSSLMQDKVENMLRHEVFKPWLKLSKNSKVFIWQCLQICPEDRMTVLEAECHDWLCTPAKHLEFFERLDRRMMATWKPPKQLIPLPMQLPSVLLDTELADGLTEESVERF